MINYLISFDLNIYSNSSNEFYSGTFWLLQRNDSVVPDPGWLAGILNDKAGWFPESFVEVVSAEE
jgi:hypothetical protein